MREGKTVRLVSRGRRSASGISLRVRAEVLDRGDLLACTPGTSNLILFHTDLMGTFGTVSIDPGVEQTAYGVFSDLVSLSGNRATPPPRPRAGRRCAPLSRRSRHPDSAARRR